MDTKIIGVRVESVRAEEVGMCVALPAIIPRYFCRTKLQAVKIYIYSLCHVLNAKSDLKMDQKRILILPKFSLFHPCRLAMAGTGNV